MAKRAAAKIPFRFVLDELATLAPRTRPMFGAVAVYVGEKFMLVLRDRPSYPGDNGVWIATEHEHHASLLRDLPGLRGIGLLGTRATRWRILPVEAEHFESSVLRACELIRGRDPRIGTVPKPRKSKAQTKAKPRRSRTP
jgi:hypothetical protein